MATLPTAKVRAQQTLQKNFPPPPTTSSRDRRPRLLKDNCCLEAAAVAAVEASSREARRRRHAFARAPSCAPHTVARPPRLRLMALPPLVFSLSLSV